MIHVYIGTDQRSAKIERVLEHSIHKNTTGPVEIHWMRAGDPGFCDWTNQCSQPHPPHGWATPFTCFRYAIPELHGFKDEKVIYLDSDMIVLGDLAELVEGPQRRPWRTRSLKRTDVSVIHCLPFRRAVEDKWWPSIEKMKSKGVMGARMRQRLAEHDFIEFTIPHEWDHMDRYQPGETKLIHFTDMKTQPWKPWPERFSYPKEHPNKVVHTAYEQWVAEADAVRTSEGHREDLQG